MDESKIGKLILVIVAISLAVGLLHFFGIDRIDYQLGYSRSEATSTACSNVIVTAIDTAVSTCAAEFPLCVQAAEEARIACANGYTTQCQTALQNAVTVCKSYVPLTCQSALQAAKTTCQANPKSQLCKTEVKNAAAVCKSTANQVCVSAVQTAARTIASCLETAYPECTQALQLAKTACANGYTPECQTALQNAKTQCAPEIPTICTDSDGGKNYNVKGTATSYRISFTDACTSSIQLQEAFCDLNRYVGVMSYDCPSGYACRDGACVETANKITVISPNGGEIWEQGSEQIIKWSAESSIQNVYIELQTCDAGGCAFYTNFPGYYPNTGKYSWVVKGVPSGYFPVPAGYKFKIYGTSGGFQFEDTSDNPFSISVP